VPSQDVIPVVELRKLRSMDLLDDTNALTSKGDLMVKSVIIRSSKTSSKLLGDSYQENIKMYNDIFPKLKLPTGKPARTNPKNLESAFEWFFKTYDYSWEVIMDATKMYVSDFEKKDYNYMRTSMYFIRKQDSNKVWTSDLATYCELIVNGEEDDSPDSYSGPKVV
jgi:hypothetical protein